MSYNSGERAAKSDQRYLYSGKELQDELKLDWLDFGARMYDPQLGRWHAQDPVAQYASPYIGIGNNPANLYDPNGMTAYSDYMGSTYGQGNYDRRGTAAGNWGGDTKNRNTEAGPSYGEWNAKKHLDARMNDFTDVERGRTLYKEEDDTPAVFVDYYKWGELVAQQADASTIFHFIHDEAAAYQWMRAVQDLKDGSGKILGKEVVGVLSISQQTGKKGVLILPWAGNFYDKSDAGLGFYGSFYEDNNGNRFTPLAIVHTHPANEINPSTWGNRRQGDLSSAPNFGGLPMYILGSVGYVQYYPSPSSPGLTYDLIRSNNPVSLFPK